jgi:hypothetical protein
MTTVTRIPAESDLLRLGLRPGPAAFALEGHEIRFIEAGHSDTHTTFGRSSRTVK